jgi:hypothetical protein
MAHFDWSVICRTPTTYTLGVTSADLSVHLIVFSVLVAHVLDLDPRRDISS